MITVISGTNRPGSQTAIIAQYYVETLKSAGQEVQYLDLARINELTVKEGMYNPATQCETIQSLQDEFITKANKFVIVSPEYNGSIPGILKYFIDAISIRNYATNFKGKQALLVGVASGRAGNLKGMLHLTDMMMHMGTHVHPNRLPISGVGNLTKDGVIEDEGTKEAIANQVKDFLA